VVRYGRTDGNQKSIVKTLNGVPGISVKVLSDVGDGFTDIVTGYMAKNFLIEIKDEDDPSPLTPAQKNFHGKGGTNPEREWKGQKDIAYNIEDVFRIMGIRITA
jgi:hypothetical protein